MSEQNLQSQIEAAKAYENLFVPALFGQWAPINVTAAQLQPGQRVLDIACGTGVLTREIANRVGQDGTVVGLDPNPGMLSVAGDLAPAVDFRQGTAESIPYPDHSFDAVLSQFGLMFFQNRRHAVLEMFRVLRPSGRIVVAVWDAIEEISGYAAELALIERFAGQIAADAVRFPFSLGNRDDLSALFDDTAATSVDISTRQGVARFPSIRTMVEAELRGWLPVMGVHLSEEQIDQILTEAETELSSFTNEDGAVVFDVSAHIVTASTF